MFKVGDKVKIRSDLKTGHKDYSIDVVCDMKQYRGKEATITAIDSDGDYQLDIDKEQFYWSVEMLEPITFREERSIFKVGDTVKVREDLHTSMNFGSVYVDDDMLEYVGKYTTITKVVEGGCCYLEGDGNRWCWHPEMLIKVGEDLHTKANRLAKAVCEYEEIVHNLEYELKVARQEYNELIDKYNSLVIKYNDLLENLMEDFI